jgi:NAD(P)-dependent dehydrogenase (short-subunit alcohol dehydrogenase family)
MKTVIITGSSSGIGKAAVVAFAKAGWNVAATMRNPEKENDFKSLKNVKLYPLDVTNTENIQTTLKAVKNDFKNIDVVVNNAGFGVDGIFESMSDESSKNNLTPMCLD